MDEQPPPIITPLQEPNPPLAQQLAKDPSASYMIEGVVIGVIIAISILGGLYYKSSLEAKVERESKMKIEAEKERISKQKLQEALQVVEKVKLAPTSIITPIVVQTKEDLDVQQTVLDDMNLDDISKGLDETASDSSEFAL